MGKVRKIALFVNGWTTEYASLIINGMRRQAAADGVDIFVFTSYILWGERPDGKDPRLNLFRMFDPADFDGAVLLSNTFNAPDESQTILERIKDSGIPVICTEVKLPGCAFVGTSNYKGMYELGRHLVEVHHVRDVVYVRGNEGNEECAVRRKALEDALSENGIIISDTIHGAFAFYNAANSLEEWLNAGNQLPDAFVCANDQMALGIISKLYERGIEVPRDVIVTGFDHIHEAQTSYPLVATVSRQWGQMGANVYSELMEQIEKPDPEYEHIYDSRFIPSESCGCKATEHAVKLRLDRVRNLYHNSIYSDMIDFMFQDVRAAMSKVENRQEIYEAASAALDYTDYLGPDYAICTDPYFLDSDDENYEPSDQGYPKQMEVLFQRTGGSPAPQRIYESRELYPGYVHHDGESAVYVITPLTHMEYNIGYVVIKNRPEVLYDLRFKKWTNNLDTLLLNVRQYLISQRLNARLKNIYMTDFLTGMYNRTGCEDVLFKFIESEKMADRCTMLLFIDIDCMKVINDVYGHLNGDIAIKTTAEAMRRTIPEDWKMGRFGGDEFVAVGPDNGDFDIEDVRRRFRDNMKAIVDTLNVSFRLTASVGFCIITPDSAGTIEDYIRVADVSMYEEKEKAHKAMDAFRGV